MTGHVVHASELSCWHPGKPPRFDLGHGSCLIALWRCRPVVIPASLPGQERQAPRGDLPTVQQLHGAAGGVAGIGEAEFLRAHPLAVQLLPALAGEEDLTANHQELRRVCRQYQWDVGNGPRIFRHQLASLAITTGEGFHQLPVFVTQRQGKAIHLQLSGVLQIRARNQSEQLSFPGPKLLLCVGIIQAEHGYRMTSLLKSVHRRCAHAQRRTVGIRQLRMRRFEGPQLPLQCVVFGIRDGWLIQHVVAVAVQPQLIRQCLHPQPQVGHFALARCRMPMMRPKARQKLRVLLPPALKKGSTMPLLGRAPATMPTFTSRCSAKMPAAPAQK